MNHLESPSVNRWIGLVGLALLVWAFSSGGPVRSGPDARAAAPITPVHPEVLQLQASFSRVAELVQPAVVSISTVHIEKVGEAPRFSFGDPMEQFFEQFFGAPGGEEGPLPRRRLPRGHPRQFKMEGMGSGVIINAEGMVLTNEHVVRDADQIKVLLYDKDEKKKEYTARVIGKDARTDLAVIKINAGHQLPFAALGDSEKVRVGDWAIAIGSPFGLSQTLTVGVISAARQSLFIEEREYRNLIQTDASINRGNSGGPLINIYGEVVGINTAIFAPTGVFSGIGFAVPINQAKEILDDLIERGRVVRGWLGVELNREITPAMVKAFRLPDARGALVNEVLKDSPAARAGLRRADVIRKFGGQDVASSSELQRMVAQTPPKRTVPVEIIRDGKPLTLELRLGERPESVDRGGPEAPAMPEKGDPKKTEREWSGAHVVPLTPALAETFRQPADAAGVIVTDVDAGSPAEEMGLQSGDVIRAINQAPTPDLKAFARVAEEARPAAGVVLDILRQGRPLFLSYLPPS